MTKTFTPTPGGPADLSGNQYAALMKELAEKLSEIAPLLLLGFLFWQIGTTDEASFLSVRAVLLVIAAELVFVGASLVANVVLAAVIATVSMPLVLIGYVRLMQNLSNSLLVLFGVALCVGAWFFAIYATHYAYA